MAGMWKYLIDCRTFWSIFISIVLLPYTLYIVQFKFTKHSPDLYIVWLHLLYQYCRHITKRIQSFIIQKNFILFNKWSSIYCIIWQWFHILLIKCFCGKKVISMLVTSYKLLVELSLYYYQPIEIKEYQ